MILNFKDSEAPSLYNSDICIVGSGAAALAFLTRFYSTSKSLIVLEAGGEIITEEHQKMYDVITTHHPFQGARDGRFRVFGGTTTRWGGQSLPFDTIDFLNRSWIPFSGWPISYREVYKYLNEVDQFLNLDVIPYETDLSKILQTKSKTFETVMMDKFSKWSSKPNIREEHRKKLTDSKNVTIIQNANVYSLILDSSYKSIELVKFKTIDGKEGVVKSKIYILACGGIENARLLLASNEQQATGLANENDVVGRFLQDHPNASIGTLKNHSADIQAHFNYFYLNKTRILPRLMLSNEFQIKQKILNSSAYLKFSTKLDDPFQLIKELHRKYVRKELVGSDLLNSLQIIKSLPHLFKTGKTYFFDKKIYTPNPLINLDIMFEMPPIWENRVTLSGEKDILGMPKALIIWKFNNLLFHTLDVCADIYKSSLEKLNFGKLELADWVVKKEYNYNLIDAKHHIGTTRMSNSCKNGVVNKDCRVHSIANLYIAGSSVFPTSGHSNPTSTIIALSFRLAEHLKSLKT